MLHTNKILAFSIIYFVIFSITKCWADEYNK